MISQETQHLLDELVSSGHFRDHDAAIEEAVHRLREELETNGRDERHRPSAEEWCEQFEQGASSHRRLPQIADDSRESIYAGRGE